MIKLCKIVLSKCSSTWVKREASREKQERKERMDEILVLRLLPTIEAIFKTHPREKTY
jgi:hypothetical protein